MFCLKNHLRFFLHQMQTVFWQPKKTPHKDEVLMNNLIRKTAIVYLSTVSSTIYLIQASVAVTHTLLLIFPFDMLFMILIRCTTFQFKLVNEEWKTLFDVDLSSEKGIEELRGRFRRCIQHYDFLLQYTKAINDRYSIHLAVVCFAIVVDLIHKIQSQWQILHLIKWNTHLIQSCFGVDVLNYRNGDDQPFKEPAEFCLELLILPHSNAKYDGRMNIIKSKVRNKLQLSAILSIKAGLNRYDKCCHSYNIPDENVLEKIRTKETYENVILDDEDILWYDAPEHAKPLINIIAKSNKLVKIAPFGILELSAESGLAVSPDYMVDHDFVLTFALLRPYSPRLRSFLWTACRKG
nr:unnamed protein product [Callosobruchus analis]